MSWKNSLLEASFRGVIFDCVSTDDEAERSLAEHAYPYVSGSDIEDLGDGARHISIEAVFFGDDYEQRLQNFLNAFRQPGAGELVHPVFGSIKLAQPAGYKIHHEADNVDQALLRLRFTESTPSAGLFSYTLSVQKAAAAAQSIQTVRDGAAIVLAREVGKISALTGALARIDQLRSTMTSALSAFKSQAVGIITSGLDVVKYPLAFASDIASLVNGIVDLRAFNVGSMLADWSSVFDALSTPVLLPSQAGQPVQAQTGQPVQGSQTPTPLLLPVQAGQPVRDNQVISAHVALEQVSGLADAASVVLASEAQQPTLSAPQIEAIVNATRTPIENVIAQYRALYGVEDSRPVVEALKATALNLQEAARAVIEARPPLIQKRVDAPGNLRLLAHKWYGDHTRAPELLRLNPEVRLPNFITTGDRLNAYSG